MAWPQIGAQTILCCFENLSHELNSPMIIKRLINFLALAFLPVISCNSVQQTGAAKEGAPASETEEPRIEIYDSLAFALLDPDDPIETLAQGFYWSEGPL